MHVCYVVTRTGPDRVDSGGIRGQMDQHGP